VAGTTTSCWLASVARSLGLPVLDVHETAHDLLDLLGDLVRKNALGVEIGGPPTGSLERTRQQGSTATQAASSPLRREHF